VNSTLHEYNTVQGFTSAGDGPSLAGQVCQRGCDLGMELNRAAPLQGCLRSSPSQLIARLPRTSALPAT
jgi:hypothetical protein